MDSSVILSIEGENVFILVSNWLIYIVIMYQELDNCFFLFFLSYLADQCWNGGCIYLIMLRRIKRKASLPPCNGSGGNSVDVSNEHRRNVSSKPAGSPTQNGQNGKRSRKFGVISRSSFTRNSKDSKDSQDFEHENGYSSMEAEVTSPESSTPQDTPTDDSPFIGSSELRSNHMKVGSTATLPSRSHSCLSESYKTESISSEPSSQVRNITVRKYQI